MITLFGGYLVKIYAWKSILGRDGILNLALINLNIIDEPLSALIYSANGIVVTLTYFLLPFAVLRIYSNMRAIQEATLEASRDLGASSQRRCIIVIPQCERGILVAFMFAFLISVGDYVTPRFVGGGAAMMGNFIEVPPSASTGRGGSAMAFSTMGVSLLTVIIFRRLLQQWLKP